MNFRRLIVSLYLLLFLALGAGSAFYFWGAYQEYDRLRGIEAGQKRRLAELQVKLEEQQKVLERLRTDPVYVEKVIRQRLGYAKPDEFIFRFEQ